jgi:acetylornithine deacetylase
MRVARGDAVGLARGLVAIDSRNPSLCAGAPGEGAVATALAAVLESWGCRVELIEAAAGRPNVVARVGEGGGPSLMFNGHMDVVGVDGMTHAPWDATEQNGRVYGRGSSDMKGGVAAMCAAAVHAVDQGLGGEIVIAAVVDEEFESLGTMDLIARGIRASAAIVTEPTQLAVMPAHKGFVWIDVVVHGRAAHGSRWDLGVDAIRHAGLLLAELDHLDAVLLPERRHPLLGRPSIHASLVSGGSGMSTYPDRCELRLERRTLPGETPGDVLSEIEAAAARVRERCPGFTADITLSVSRGPSDVSADAPICAAVREALTAEGITPTTAGMTAWTDAALLNEAGIPAICFGPGDMGVAHAAEEFIVTDQIRTATVVLARVAGNWTRGT